MDHKIIITVIAIVTFLIIKKIISSKKMKNLENILKASNNNIIVDVRTKAEFQEGHIKGSVNIPLDNISNAAEQLRKYDNIILVCASGMRSLQACKILAGLNMSNVYNGGSWTMLNGFIS